MYHGAGHYSDIEEEDFKKIDSFIENGKFKTLSEKGSFLLLKRIQQ